MALTKTPIELSSTPSIVDGGNATAITIDSSEKVLIGTGTSGSTDLLQVESPASGGGHGIQIRRNDNNTDQQVGRIMMGNVVDSDLGQIAVKTDGANNSGAILFSTASAGTTAERLRINASGNVGIGCSPSYLIHADSATATDPSYITASSGSDFIVAMGSQNSPGVAQEAFIGTLSDQLLKIKTNNTERMRIDGGNVLVGRTSASFGSATGLVLRPNNDSYIIADGSPGLTIRRNSSNGDIMQFYRDGTQVGYISATTTGVSYQSGSDQRLKENIADADDAGSKIDAIKVRKFDWIADGSHQDYGMIAQELQTVAPEAVGGDADSDKMMGVDYSKLVPMLVKEIQSLRSRVAELENN